MINISTQRFDVKSNGDGTVTVLDKMVNSGPHQIVANKLPSVLEMAMMNATMFDRHLSETLYGN